MTNSNFTNSNSSYNVEEKYEYFNNSDSRARNSTEYNSLRSNNFDVDALHENGANRGYISDSSPVSGYIDDRNRIDSMNYAMDSYESDARPVYADEWHATEGKAGSPNLRRDVGDDGRSKGNESSLRRS